MSPGYPDNYPAYLACKWRIQAAPGKKILATFSEFDVTASNNCNSDYVTVTTGGGRTKACIKRANEHGWVVKQTYFLPR